MNVRIVFLWELVAWCTFVHNADSIHPHGCYDSGNWFHLSCNSSTEVIALDNVYVIAMSSNCTAGGPGKDTPTPTCCETDMDVYDCKMSYTGESVATYHETCSGENVCGKEIERQSIACGSKEERQFSNYMAVEYHCVEASGIVRIPENESANGTTVYIQNKGYPTSGPSASVGMCSVTASHNSSIDVSLLHLNITCQQYIDVLDGNVRERIGCGNNTNYSSGIIYTSRNNFISLNWTSEVTASARLWIQFTATNGLANLELRCVSSSTPEPNNTMITKSHGTTLPKVTMYTEATKTSIKFTNNLSKTPVVSPVLSTFVQTLASIPSISTMMPPKTSNPQTSAASPPISTMMPPITSSHQTSAASVPISTMMPSKTSSHQTSATSLPISTMMPPITSSHQTSKSSLPISTMMPPKTSNPQNSAASPPISTMMPPITSSHQTSAASVPISTMMPPKTSSHQTSAASVPISTMMPPITSSHQTSAASVPISTMMPPKTSSHQTSAASVPISTMMPPKTSSHQTSATSLPISTMMPPITSSHQTSASILSNGPYDTDTTTNLTASPRGGMSLAEAAGTGIGVVLFILLLLMLMYFWHKKKHQRVKVGCQDSDILDPEFADALGITRANMGSTAPVFAIPPKPRRLAPIEVPGIGIHV